MPKSIGGEFVEDLRTRVPLVARDAVRWIGEQDPRKLSMTKVVRELLYGRPVFGCFTIQEAILKFENRETD